MKDFFGNPEQLEELVAYIASQINVPTIGIGGGDAPIGKIDFFEANVAPQDWLACDGTVYNISDYPQLAEHYTAVYGEANHWGGNGTTTFAVPDLRGEFLRGAGNNSHTNQGNGANVGEHQDGTSFPYVAGYDDTVCVYRNTNKSNNGPLNEDVMVVSSGNGNRIGAATVNVDYPGPRPFTITSRPTNTSFLICVKAVVAGDVYSTDERVGGTWIDGKKWYYKTIDFGALPNATSKNVAHGISNVDNIWIFDGFSMPNDKSVYIPIPFASTVISNAIVAKVDKTYLTIDTDSDRSVFTKTYVTIRYTKTTD